MMVVAANDNADSAVLEMRALARCIRYLIAAEAAFVGAGAGVLILSATM
jgi:hypothetical protein